jgi:hypothetical protein
MTSFLTFMISFYATAITLACVLAPKFVASLLARAPKQRSSGTTAWFALANEGEITDIQKTRMWMPSKARDKRARAAATKRAIATWYGR